MSNESNSNNVIQFPGGKRKEAEESNQPPALPQNDGSPKKPAPKSKRSKVTAGTVLAIVLATGAVNRFAFQESKTFETTSNSSRSIASVAPMNVERDASWEKMMAEQLASVQPRSVASVGIGHSATVEEKLRWGILGEKYTIVYHSEHHKIETIFLQDAAVSPSYVLDRKKFLKDFGGLLTEEFSKAELKSVKTDNDKTVESYTLFGKDQRPSGEARFELDIHKRLLSLKVESTQI